MQLEAQLVLSSQKQKQLQQELDAKDAKWQTLLAEKEAEGLRKTSELKERVPSTTHG